MRPSRRYTHDDGPERVTGSRRSRRTATRERHQDRSPALDHHPTVPATPVELGTGRGRHLPSQPCRKPRAGGDPRRRGRRHRGAAARDIRRLRDKPARVHAAIDLHAARCAHPGLGPVLQPARSGRPTAAPDDRDDQGAPGVRARQQPRVRAAVSGDARADHPDAGEGAYPRRPGRADHPRCGRHPASS